MASCRRRALSGLRNAASRRVRAPARQLGTPAPAGVFASVTPLTGQYDEGPASGRSSGPSAVLSLIDAAGPRRNGQPEAREEWPCHQVAAFSPVGATRRRAKAGTLAS